MKRSLKTFTEYPADGEIVLFKDETGTYYRGRVIGSDPSDDNLYEVSLALNVFYITLCNFIYIVNELEKLIDTAVSI